MEFLEFKVIIICILASFLLAVIIGPFLITLLRRLNFGQEIRIDGPQGHLKKKGTPTMGGIIILIALTVVTLRFAEKNTTTLILLISTLGYGLIGFLDDYIKIWFKRSLGLTAKQKLLGQLILAGIVIFLFVHNHHSTMLAIPLTKVHIQLGIFYYLLVILMFLGTSNAVNITDGLDGLLSGTGAIAFGTFALIAVVHTKPDAAFFAAAVVGAVLGFLVFNAHPAKIFMGDTGSLALGGGLAALAMVTKSELWLIWIGGVFVIEMLSVILQVISFKTRGKRIFKMSPLHHHFELVGWSEWRVVTTFWFAGVLFSSIGLILHEVLK